MYTPISPAHDVRAYEPQSPRMGNSRAERIIAKIQSTTPPPFKKVQFLPLCNYHKQIESMRFSGEFTDEFLRKFIEKHEKYYEENPGPVPKTPNEPINIPECVDDSVTITKTLRNGTTRTKTEAPMADIGCKNIFKVPINEYIIAMKKFGYPDWVLEQTLAKYQKIQKNRHEYDGVFDSLFSKYKSSKPAKPKKKHIRDKALKFVAKRIQLDDEE